MAVPPLQIGRPLPVLSTGFNGGLGFRGPAFGPVPLNSGSPGSFAKNFGGNGVSSNSFQSSNSFGTVPTNSAGNIFGSIPNFGVPFTINNVAMEQAAVDAFRAGQGQVRVPQIKQRRAKTEDYELGQQCCLLVLHL